MGVSHAVSVGVGSVMQSPWGRPCSISRGRTCNLSGDRICILGGDKPCSLSGGISCSFSGGLPCRLGENRPFSHILTGIDHKAPPNYAT